ncbi:MAG TPA: crosslink repair DNA glycosylase YcaQ family protein [Solirubrobacter sp.]|nr:crosslink repair DNA glycosylase YcaQ family protein [Solirubrobacter sp.]
MRVLTRAELTAALAVRQSLHERAHAAPADAIRRLTPLQAQHPTAPHIALAARLHDFAPTHLDAAIDDRAVVKCTLLRTTLHLTTADDFPAYTQVARQARLRTLRAAHPDLDLERLTRDLTQWLRTPRTNPEIRERVSSHPGAPQGPNQPILAARTWVPLVQLPPGGHWKDTTRGARYVLDPRPLPDPREAGALVLTRYLEAFGPASRRDVAAWAGVAQRDLPFERVETVAYRDEKGTELLDLPGAPLPPGDLPLPPRFLGRWEQPLLAYADRDRIIPPDLQPLKLTLSGDQTLLVDGRVVASWWLRKGTLELKPHTDFRRTGIREEGLRTARFCAPHHKPHQLVEI